MGKIKKATQSSPKKRGRQASKHVDEVVSSTSKENEQKKSNKKNARIDVNGDSGISSPEETIRTPKSVSRISGKSKTAISKKSKSAISKKPKAGILNKTISDVNWLGGLLDDKSSNLKSSSGIEARFPRVLSHRKEKGTEYVTFPAFKGFCGGYVKINGHCEKASKKTGFTMNFLILIGHVELVSGNQSTEYSTGTVITVPKGVRYGLRNRRKDTCFMRFQTIPEN